eukprot:scaffold191061_cov17-Tisochrysis_lutea.AAC.1
MGLKATIPGAEEEMVGKALSCAALLLAPAAALGYCYDPRHISAVPAPAFAVAASPAPPAFAAAPVVALAFADAP